MPRLPALPAFASSPAHEPATAGPPQSVHPANDHQQNELKEISEKWAHCMVLLRISVVSGSKASLQTCINSFTCLLVVIHMLPQHVTEHTTHCCHDFRIMRCCRQVQMQRQTVHRPAQLRLWHPTLEPGGPTLQQPGPTPRLVGPCRLGCALGWRPHP